MAIFAILAPASIAQVPPASPADASEVAAELAARAATAERLAREATRAIRLMRERQPGAAARQADRESGLDADRAALIGAELTPLVTTLGSLESKHLATDPRWAGVLVRQLAANGVRPGTAVAASFSGSFPGLNLAVMAACRALDARLVAGLDVGSERAGRHVARNGSCDRRCGRASRRLPGHHHWWWPRSRA
jgi:poly-gamma-glutamate system protein